MTGLRSLVALLLCAVSSMATADALSQRQAVDALFAEYNRSDGAGVAVGVYQAGQQRYSRGYGMADLESGTVITPDTVFPIASVSKQFTAFAILLLAREGKVDLDADVRTYLPNVPDFGHKITVRHLLYHTSGLRDIWTLFWLAGMDGPTQSTQAASVRLITRQRALNFVPGSEHQYSNAGYVLLAEIIKAVSGQSLRAFTTARIFKPLRMDHTFFLDDATELVSRRALSYCWKYFYCQNEDQAWRRELGGSEVVGPTGLNATVGDLAKWAGNFTHPTVGDKALIDQFTALGHLDNGAPINYGFGLWHEKISGRDAVVHTGANEGFRMMFVYLPKEDFSVAVLANTNMDVLKLAAGVVTIYLGNQNGEPAKPLPAVVSQDAATIAAVTGQYQRIGQSALVFERQDKQLVEVHPAGAKPVPMTFRKDGTFDAGDEQRRLGQYYRPVRDAQGRIIALDQGTTGVDPFSDAGGPVRHVRVTPIDAAKVDLRELVGDYRSEELDVTYHVYLENGSLKLESLRLPSPIPLDPIYQDAFQGRRYFSHVVMQRDANGRITALLASSSGDRNIRFERVQ